MIGTALLSRIPLAAWTAAGAVALMAVPLGVQTVRLGSAHDRIETLDERIEDMSARLAVCRGNVAGLSSALDDQNAAVSELEAQAAAQIARYEAAAEQARADAEAARARARDILDRPIQGETVCERVLDVDAAVMTELEG